MKQDNAIKPKNEGKTLQIRFTLPLHQRQPLRVTTWATAQARCLREAPQ